MMKAPSAFVLVSLVSGLVSGLVVAMTLLYLPQHLLAVDSPGRSRPTADTPATGSGAVPTADTSAPQPMLSASTPTPVPQAPLRQYQAQLPPLERRRHPRERPHNTPRDATEDGQAQAQPIVELTLKEGRAADLAWWKETQERFEREEADPQWAAATTPLFVADMADLGEVAGFSLVQTTCRSTQCAAVLKWSSYGEATQGYAALLHHPYQANCARHTLLPAPDATEAEHPYFMTIIFDCSKWR
jgi:hypothetical protein